ncbi:hypothetical protein ANCCAN_19716, partial [Ancylostoma caninum]
LGWLFLDFAASAFRSSSCSASIYETTLEDIPFDAVRQVLDSGCGDGVDSWAVTVPQDRVEITGNIGRHLATHFESTSG